MKNYLIILFVLIITMSACKTNHYNDSEVITSMKFKQQEYDFGTLKMNSTASIEFEFLNTGNKPLVITKVVTNCDCAKPVWPEKPIKPGETGEIGIDYDTSHPGRFIKTLKVYANIYNPPIELKIHGAIE